ncbi:MAG: hypothetical protein ACRDZW_03175 [Acidimicrobiales bacterium]
MARSGDRQGPAPSTGRDWTAQAADTVERLVVGLRDKTAVPLATVARAVVYGLLAAVMGATALILAVAGLVRALDAYLPGQVWSAYAVLGGISTVLGGLLLRKASTKRAPARKGAGGR